MLKAINTKILLAILAVLTAIGGLVIHQNHVNEAAAAAAAKSAAILQEQQKATEQQKREDEKFWKQVEANKNKHSSDIGGGSNSNKYIP